MYAAPARTIASKRARTSTSIRKQRFYASILARFVYSYVCKAFYAYLEVDRRSPHDTMHGTMTTTLLFAALIGIVFIGFMQWRSQSDGDPRLKAEIERKTQEIGELKNQLIESKSEKDKLSGQGKQIFAELANVKADAKAISSERDMLQKQVNRFEEEQARREKDQESHIEKLATAEKNFESEKARVIREEEDQRKHEAEEKNRIWAEHENKVVAELSDLCNQPQFMFTSFDNTNLPESFHGSLKPDFMIEFLEQYVIFDVKVSEAKNLQVYINDQVKKTAQKIKGNEKIYSSIFLVVPTVAIKDLKKRTFYEEGYSFFVVSPESIAPLLALFKKIENYEFAEAMDPQERENIVDLVAAFDFHISSRNALELQIMKHGIETLSQAEKANPELVAEAMIKKAKMRNVNLSTAETKELVANPKLVAEQLLELIKPKAKLAAEDTKIG